LFCIFLTACAQGGIALTGASSGNVSSPNFPNNFPQNSLCVWNITVPSGRIKLTFYNFTFEPNDKPDCSGDSQGARLIITNVASKDDGITEFKLCGRSIPPPVYSVATYLGIQLRTLNNVYSGFNASYETITDEMCKYLHHSVIPRYWMCLASFVTPTCRICILNTRY